MEDSGTVAPESDIPPRTPIIAGRTAYWQAPGIVGPAWNQLPPEQLGSMRRTRWTRPVSSSRSASFHATGVHTPYTLPTTKQEDTTRNALLYIRVCSIRHSIILCTVTRSHIWASLESERFHCHGGQWDDGDDRAGAAGVCPAMLSTLIGWHGRICSDRALGIPEPGLENTVTTSLIVAPESDTPPTRPIIAGCTAYCQTPAIVGRPGID